MRIKQYLREKKYRFLYRIFCFLRQFEWKKLKEKHIPIKGDGGLFVIPCDPWSLTGSRGDEAMLMVLEQRFPNMPYHVVTTTPMAEKSALAHGWIPEPCWVEKNLLKSVFETVTHIQPSVCAVLGADVMDGYYSPESSIAFWALADIMAFHGIPTSLLGFSFNSRPHPKVLNALKKMDSSFVYQLRDPLSLKRFEFLTGKSGKLVADVAFLLEPDKGTSYFEELCKWKHTEGRHIFAVNLHPMLIKHASCKQIDQMITSLHTVLDLILETTDWNILLLPHDDRGKVNDNICLTPLHERLIEKWRHRVRHLPDVLDAAKLKGIVSLADALITSRMHLGIAGLSQGIPTMGFSYQEKFQGMVQHFGLDDQFILPLPQPENNDIIIQHIRWMFDNVEKIHQRLLDRLPNVLALAKRNFDSFKYISKDMMV